MIDLKRDIDLKNYLPPVTRDSKDVQALFDSENIEFNKLWDALCQLMANAFIQYMNIYGVERWEEALNIIKLDSQSIEDRKEEILKVLRGQRPYTLRAFRRILRNVFGEGVLDVKLLPNKFELWITIEPNINYRVNDISELTDRIIPLNLLYYIAELRQTSGNLYIAGYGRLSSVFKADGGSVTFDKFTHNRQRGGYVRMVSINKVGG